MSTASAGRAREHKVQRFWSRVEKTPTCWLWTGYTTSRGYGQLGKGSGPTQAHLAHRVAYELLVGPVPAGLELDHLCRNPPCVNPSHLEPVTHAENMRRAGAVVTQCKHGHPYDEANTYIRPDRGTRQCRACSRVNQANIRRRAA